MKNMIVMLVIVMSMSFLFGTFSKEDAINLVLNDILKDELDFVDVYVKADSMCASDTLHLQNDDPIMPPYSGNWVFFVDDLPRTHWYHSCRYLFISTIDGTKYEISRSIFPNGLSSDFVVVSRWERPTTTIEFPPLPDPQTPNPVYYNPNSHLWAVMIIGNTDLCDYEFWNSASQFYTMLKSWGFTEDQIKVHYLEGMGPDNKQSLDSENHVTDDDIDFSAQESSIAATFVDLAATLTPEDILVVNISGHGQNVGNETNFSVPGGVVFDYELADMLNNIECSSIITLLNFCHAGGFVSDLADTSSALCKNRTIHTACSINEESSGDRWITMHIDDSNYVSLIDEFPFYWTTAAQGMYPLFIDKGESLRYFEPVPYLHGDYNTGSFPFECYSYDAWNNAYSNPQTVYLQMMKAIMRAIQIRTQMLLEPLMNPGETMMAYYS